MNFKLNKLSRLLFAAAAILLGGVLQRTTGKPVFFLLGVLAGVVIFGFLGRGEQFRQRKEQKKGK